MAGVVKTKKSFGELAQIIEASVDGMKRDFAQEVYNDLIRPAPDHPYDTGTLVHSWRVSTTTRGEDSDGNYQQGVVPEVIDHKGVYPQPIMLDKKFVKGNRKFYVYNNQPYVNKLNDMKQYTNWIQASVDRAATIIRTRKYG